MNILLLTDGIYPFTIGGMQKHSFYLARFMVRAGHKVTLVHCLTGNATMPSKAEVLAAIDAPAENLRIITLRFPSISNLPGHYLKESFLFSRISYKAVEAEIHGYDFIYAKGFAASFFLEQKKKDPGMPPIGVKFHGYEMFQPAPDFATWMRHLLLRGATRWNNLNADFVFSYGGKITEIISNLGVNREKIIEIPTGIERDWLRKLPLPEYREPLRFLFIGRYERRKGIEELNSVLRQLPANLSFHFDFIGPIPSAKKIKSERITYHGKVMEKDKLTALIDRCHVLVTPSHSEGMPNVIMEGMARGLAVIATDTGAVSLMVGADNGWLIAPRDTRALRQSLEAAVALTPLALLQLRLRSMDKVNTSFLWENVAAQTLSEIEKRTKR